MKKISGNQKNGTYSVQESDNDIWKEDRKGGINNGYPVYLGKCQKNGMKVAIDYCRNFTKKEGVDIG